MVHFYLPLSPHLLVTGSLIISFIRFSNLLIPHPPNTFYRAYFPSSKENATLDFIHEYSAFPKRKRKLPSFKHLVTWPRCKLYLNNVSFYSQLTVFPTTQAIDMISGLCCHHFCLFFSFPSILHPQASFLCYFFFYLLSFAYVLGLLVLPQCIGLKNKQTRKQNKIKKQQRNLLSSSQICTELLTKLRPQDFSHNKLKSE